MDRRSFIIGSGVATTAAGFGLTLKAQGVTAATWIGPSSITPLQSYVLIAIENGYLAEEGING